MFEETITDVHVHVGSLQIWPLSWTAWLIGLGGILAISVAAIVLVLSKPRDRN